MTGWTWKNNYIINQPKETFRLSSQKEVRKLTRLRIKSKLLSPIIKASKNEPNLPSHVWWRSHRNSNTHHWPEHVSSFLPHQLLLLWSPHSNRPLHLLRSPHQPDSHGRCDPSPPLWSFPLRFSHHGSTSLVLCLCNFFSTELWLSQEQEFKAILSHLCILGKSALNSVEPQ